MMFLKLTHILMMIVGAMTLVALKAEAAPGDLDTTFDPGPVLWQGFDFPAFKYATVIQPDGKILIGGQFNTVGAATRNFVARLNPNGSLDSTFNSPLEVLILGGNPTGEVYELLLQPDGRIIVGGYFGVAGQYKTVVRLNADGSLDPSFSVTTNNGSTNFNHIYRMLLQPDGKIIIGSNALESVNGVTTNSVARLTSTGALDTALGVTGNIVIGLFALALQPDGRIIVGGGDGGGTALSRLNPDGTPDGGFTPPALGLVSIDSLALEADGQILVGARGRHTVNGTMTDALIRLNPNGTYDPTFDPPDIRTAWSLYVQSDGKIAVGGAFTINFGLFLSSFGRLNPDGSLDFMPIGGGPDNDVFDIARQTDGKYIVTGAFENFYEAGGPVPRTGVVRILEAPTPLTGKIVYNSRPDGINLEIYSMNADGTNQTRVTFNDAADYDPGSSTDGSRIAFVSDRDKNDEIYVMNANGTGQTRLTNNIERDVNPSFSPDGTKIVFSSLRDGNWEIYVMDANGLNQTRLTTNTSIDDEPSFSPNGNKIVFSSTRDGNREIYAMDVNGANQMRLTVNAAVDTEPAFSPDGSKIAFRSFRDGNSEVYVMNSDGSRQWNITKNPAADFNPSFSPDSSRMAFVTDRDSGQIEIYVMNWVGSSPVRYTNNTVEDSRPSWGGGTTTPPAPPTRLKIDNGNILIGSPGAGLLIRMPNGLACVKIAIDNAGALATTTVPCS
jgi:uncharacterized delta-60 repeat protein